MTAAIYTLIGTARVNNINPQAWPADVLGGIADTPHTPQTGLYEFLSWHWKAERQINPTA